MKNYKVYRNALTIIIYSSTARLLHKSRMSNNAPFQEDSGMANSFQTLSPLRPIKFIQNQKQGEHIPNATG